MPTSVRLSSAIWLRRTRLEQRPSHNFSGGRGRRFLILLFAGTTGTTTTIARHSTADSLFYSGLFSMFGRIVLVVIPMLLGVREGRANALPARLVVAISTIAIIGLTMWTATPVEYALTFGRRAIPLPGVDGIVGTPDDLHMFMPWASLLMFWPTAAIVAWVMRDRQRRIRT